VSTVLFALDISVFFESVGGIDNGVVISTVGAGVCDKAAVAAVLDKTP
jgi:hypothetical protein